MILVPNWRRSLCIMLKYRWRLVTYRYTQKFHITKLIHEFRSHVISCIIESVQLGINRTITPMLFCTAHWNNGKCSKISYRIILIGSSLNHLGLLIALPCAHINIRYLLAKAIAQTASYVCGAYLDIGCGLWKVSNSFLNILFDCKLVN